MNYADTLAAVKKCFSPIIGMNEQKTQLIESCMSGYNGGEFVSPYIEAEAGMGKTRLMQAYADALEIVGLYVLILQPNEFRKSGDAGWTQLINCLCERRTRYAVLIDEMHELFQAAATVQCKKIASFLLKALDGNFHGGSVQLGDNIVANFNRKDCVIVGATNYPGRVPEAIKSRAARMILPEYSVEDLRKILVMMIKSSGLTIDEKESKMIAKCGRGTARPMEKIVRQLGITLSSAQGDRKKVNRDDVLHALRQLQMYPRGLDRNEVLILQRCRTSPVADRIMQQMFPGMDVPALRRSRAYLMQETEGINGEPDQPLLGPVTGGVQTTPKGNRYLAEIQKTGFAI